MPGYIGGSAPSGEAAANEPEELAEIPTAAQAPADDATPDPVGDTTAAPLGQEEATPTNDEDHRTIPRS